MILHTALQNPRPNIEQFVPTKDTTYLALMDDLRGVCCEDMGENWLHYHGTTHDTVKAGMGIVPFHNDFYMPDESPRFPFLAATKQLYEWSFPSIRRSVRLFVIKNDRNDVHAKGQDQRSKVKVTEVMNPFTHFQTVTPVWIHIWWWNDAQSLMLFRRGALLFFNVIHQISRSRG